jgi:hypothetical protein
MRHWTEPSFGMAKQSQQPLHSAQMPSALQVVGSSSSPRSATSWRSSSVSTPQ